MVLSVLVENRAGVLSHVVGLFSARGFNIDSLAVGETQDPTASRITLVTRGDARTLEQIKKQLNRLIDVIKIQDLSQDEYVDRELMLVKVRATPEARAALEPLMAKYRVHVADENDSVMTLECTESRENRKKLFEGLKAVGIIEMAQTGAVALGKKSPKSE
ncbi:MAG: acetolactate synthase small subunit [Omnitrophica bacterium RIFCSPHIGHO2_02_FULL_63_14]|nr:MAG: acetolactate synthase small subunit [Omnitrophica bacterium RIFCSPHIGHO2_02_FULL_63_14]